MNTEAEFEAEFNRLLDLMPNDSIPADQVWNGICIRDGRVQPASAREEASFLRPSANPNR